MIAISLLEPSHAVEFIDLAWLLHKMKNTLLADVGGINKSKVQMQYNPSSETITINPPIGKCQIKGSACIAYGPKYKVTYPSDEGITTEQIYLCDWHVKEAIEQGMEIAEV